MIDRARIIQAAVEQLGKPYIWGSRGPDSFDPAGLVLHALYAVTGKDKRSRFNAQMLSDALPDSTEPQPGDLCVYGTDLDNVQHIMLWVGDGRVLGACGGDWTVRTKRDAILKGARVQYRRQLNYRLGFLGFRDVSVYGVLP